MKQHLRSALDRLSSRRILLFGGKGGVGKTTVASAAALHLAETRDVILFSTDPASNLHDLFHAATRRVRIEALDADVLYQRFLAENLESFLEIGDRGTYLDKEELRRLFQLALPGVDELMAWMRIGELAESEREATLVVDTAPTGHTLRMLASSDHFGQLAHALDAMQAKHRAMVRQFTRRDVRDAIDAFIEDFDARASRWRATLSDPAVSAFVPVFLSEPWVVEQTLRLIAEVRADGIDVPCAVLNRAIETADCERDRARAEADREAMSRLEPIPVAVAPRSCVPLDSVERLRDWLTSAPPRETDSRGDGVVVRGAVEIPEIVFVAGKGGVGKTTTATSIALQRARANPERRFVLISVDPAHSLRDVFAHEAPPANLEVETIDTAAKWKRFREKLGAEIEAAIDGLSPRGMSLEYDSEAMKRLIEIAPPGADELFAINRLADLFTDETLGGVIVDTAPTGHFLRLLDLPKSAGEWVREFMRLLLRYRELVPAGSLGEELVRASRALRELDETIRSERCAVLVVARPERIVVAETRRLIADVESRGIRVAGVVANYVTPENDCACDRSMRTHETSALSAIERPHETSALSAIERPLMVVERRDAPVITLAAIEGLLAIPV